MRTGKDLISCAQSLIKKGGKALLLVGPIGAGKTRAAARLVEGLRALGLSVGGVISPRVMRGGQTMGYLVRDLHSGEERPLCSLEPPGIAFRRFYFSPEGIALGNRALQEAAREAQVIVVDEVGPLELTGGGFAPGVEAVRGSGAFLVLSVRPFLVPEILRWLDLPTDTPTWRLGT